MSKFKVGDLVEHRASGQRGVVCDVREDGSECVPVRYEYQLDCGYSYMARSAAEAWSSGDDIWMPEYVLEQAAPRSAIVGFNMPACENKPSSDESIEKLAELLANKIAEKLAK